MLIAAMVLRYLHIILGITWFGGTVYRSLILLPGLATLSPEQRRPFLQSVQEGHETFLLTTGFLVIVLGIMLGAVVGPIQSGSALFTAYGVTWIASMTLAAIILGWEGFMVSPAIAALAPDDAEEVVVATEPARAVLPPVPSMPGSLRRAQTLAWIEVGGFCLLVSFMVLMHFGY
ncbi:MAG: hypothetical protein H0X24_19855 [Ktedonobacterales bacterium]|nr:hypothetical protein [Ktedonobacterales bacterium]